MNSALLNSQTRIVRDHGGRIQLESNVGQGTFRVWLPLSERAPRLLDSPESETAVPPEQ